MAFPSVTNTFTNGTTSDATQVNQNFTDLVNGLSDGTKSLAVAGIATSSLIGTIALTGSLAASGAISASGGLMRSSALAVNGAATDRGYGIFGTTAGFQVQIDSDEIQAMNNNTPTSLNINIRGGNTTIGKDTTNSLSILNIVNLAASLSLASSAYTTNKTLGAADCIVYANANAGSTSYALPAANASPYAVWYTIFKTDSTSNTVTITPNGADTIDGAASVVLGGNVGRSRLVIFSDGSASWRIAELYEEGTYTATLTGCTTSPTITVTYVRNGKQVTLRHASLFATSNSTACTLTGMPSHIYPGATTDATVPSVYNAGNTYPGIVRISTAGVVTPSFYDALTAFNGTFTNSATNKGLALGVSISYITA
jgi:hypothetical protein